MTRIGMATVRRLRNGAATAALVIATTAAAQTGRADDAPAATAVVAVGLPDIVVTSQRRRESIQDVPIAVSAFSADLLSARNIATPLQLTHYVPGVFGSNGVGLGSANTYFIRGLGNTETLASFDPAVGTYVDDIYLARQNANNFAFFDIDRIEVLRGPQGTLSGRNTTGGAINVLLKRPADTLGGLLEATYGSYGRKTLRGSIDMPLAPAVQLKLSGYYQDDGGYVQNTTTGERLNDSDMAGLRGAVQLKASDRLTWNVAAAYMRNDGENLLNFECDPANPANCAGRFATTGLVKKYAPGTTSPFVALGVTGAKAEFGLGNRTETQMYTSNLEWSGDAVTLNAITGLVDTRQRYLLDFADGRGTPNAAVPVPPVRGFGTGGFVLANDGSHRQFTQELRISGTAFGGGIDYVGGLFYIHEQNRTDFADIATGAGGVATVLADRTVRNTTNSIAGYAQVDANVTDRLKLTAGVRYTDEKRAIGVADNRPACQSAPTATCLDSRNLFVALPGGPLAIPLAQKTRQWTPRAVISFKPGDDTMVYASATRGFQSGGWNARATTPAALLPFDPQTVWSYELGARAELFEHRVRVNITGFWLDARQLQTASAFVDPATGGATFVTQNVGGYRNRGVELEVTAAPVSGLNLYANVAYQNDSYRIDDTTAPNRFGVKAVRQQQRDCLAQLAQGRVPLGPGGAGTAPDCAAGIIDANGAIATPRRTPAFSIAVGGGYDYPIPAAGIVLTPSINAQYSSRLETGTANGTLYTGSITATGGATFPANPFGGDVITGSLASAFVQVGAALTLRTDDDNWTLSLACENCLDKAFVQSTLVNYRYLSPPRTWQLRARRVF